MTPFADMRNYMVVSAGSDKGHGEDEESEVCNE